MTYWTSQYTSPLLEGDEEKDEEKLKKETAGSVQDRLLKGRRILLSSPVTAKTAEALCTKLLVLDQEKTEAPITFFINSPGGSVYDGFAIYDTMKMLRAPIRTVVFGLAASFGSILALGASPGLRFATKNSRFMIHQPLIAGSVRGSASDIVIETQQMVDIKKHLTQIYIDATGQTEETIRNDTERNRWFDAKGAQSYGLIDKIISSLGEVT